MADFNFKQYIHPDGTFLSSADFNSPEGLFSSVSRTDRKFTITNLLFDKYLRLRVKISGNFITDEQIPPGALS